MFALVERYIGAKMPSSATATPRRPVAFEAIVRLTDEELKHQELFRRIERLAASGMPAGYRFDIRPTTSPRSSSANATGPVLRADLPHRAVLAGALPREHRRRRGLSPLFKDVFLFHWKEESQHAVIDELEWLREDAKLTSAERDAAIDDLIALVGGVDGILQTQAKADAGYFARVTGSRAPSRQRRSKRRC